MFQCYGSLPSLRAWHAQRMSSGLMVDTLAVQHTPAAASCTSQRTADCGRMLPLDSQCCRGSRRCLLRPGYGHRKRRRLCLVLAVGNPPPPPPGDDSGFGASDPRGTGGDVPGGNLTPEEAARFGGGRDSVGRAQQAAAAGIPPPPGVPPPPPPFRQRTRLAEALLAAPSRTDRYFDDHPGRRWLWLAISFAAGFYCANTVSLSFGTLAVNDVVAAAVTVGFCEVVSYAYYQAETVTYPLALANAFKMGVIAALISDALKLQG